MKGLTQQVQDIALWVKDWHVVVSALENLSIEEISDKLINKQNF